MAQGAKACRVAPENLATGQASNPLKTISTIEAAANDRAARKSKDFAESEIKINTGSTISMTSLFAPAKSGLTRRPYRKPTSAKAKMGSVMAAIFENMNLTQFEVNSIFCIILYLMQQ
jgi:hypothetical protein